MHWGRTVGQGAEGAGELLETGTGELPIEDAGELLGTGAGELPAEDAGELLGTGAGELPIEDAGVDTGTAGGVLLWTMVEVNVLVSVETVVVVW